MEGNSVNPDDAFERCLELLYRAALDDASWSAVSAAIDESCGAVGNALVVAERSGDVRFIQPLYRGEANWEVAREYLENYYPHDEVMLRRMASADGRLLHMSEIYSETELKTSVAYNEGQRLMRAQDGINVCFGDPRHKVDGRLPPPRFASASVDGTTLIVVFDEALDEDFVPTRSAFRVTVNGAGRSVASGGVAIDGAAVRLTLSSAVLDTDEVKVRYVKPRSNGLRDAAGHQVETFADQDVATDETPPVFSSAAVNGAALTLTFNELLDTGSKPAPGAFHVTVGSDRRNVAPGGVSVSGRDVTLTLASAVVHGDTVKVRYTTGTNPLRDPAGNDVATFADRAVTNETPVPDRSAGVPEDAFWYATLTLKNLGIESGCSDAIPEDLCSAELSWSTFMHGDETYRVTKVGFFRQVSKQFASLKLDKAWPANLRNNAVWHVGARQLSLADATFSETGYTASWTTSHISGTAVGSNIQLALTPSSGSSGDSGPAFQAASVTGNKLKVTYDEPLDESSAPPGGSFRVTTTPEGGANGNGRRAASGGGPGNIGGTGTASVDGSTVTVTLNRPVAPGQRVMVSYTPPPNNPVRDAAGAEAAAFSGRPAANVAPAPAVTGVAVVSDAGDDNTYALGETLRVRLTFGEKVAVDASGGTPRVKIKMDPRWGEFWAGYESGGGTKALTFAYTVKKPNTAPTGIAVLANTLQLNRGTIKSASTQTNANLAHAGLGHDAKHKVDWRLSPPSANPAPTVTGVAVVSDAGSDNTYALGETLRVRLTFGETVNVGGTPRVKIKMDPRWGEFWAGYESGSGTNALTFAYTVKKPNTAPSGIAVLANTLQINGGTIASAATGANASLSHAGLGHNSAHKVDWRLSPPGAVGAGDTTAPAPESATVNARAVTVTFDEALVPVGTDAYLHFTLTVTGAGVQQHPVRASASGKTVTMQLGAGSPARAGQSYAIGYFGGGMLKDAAGNEVARFSGLAAENLTLPVLKQGLADALFEGTGRGPLGLTGEDIDVLFGPAQTGSPTSP